MLRFLIAWAFFSVSPALAEPEGPACDTAIDLRERGESMAGLLPTDQGEVNTCGYFAFSTYLDSYRISREGERGAAMARASAVGVGVENALRRGLPFWFPIQQSTDPLATRLGRWGATFCALANSVREVGYCADASLPTRTAEETAEFGNVTAEIYAGLLKIAETPAPLRGRALDRMIEGLHAKYVAWGTKRGEGVLLGPKTLRSLIESNITRPYETIRAVFFPNCGQSEKRRADFRFDACKTELYVGLDVLGVPTRDRDPLRTDRAARRVAELLERPHALPVPFAYCSSVLTEGKRYVGSSPAFGGNCGIHWSVIAGRRRIGKDCYLLVHNSWEAKATYSKDWMNDRGGIWVRERELIRSMLLVQWLEN